MDLASLVGCAPAISCPIIKCLCTVFCKSFNNKGVWNYFSQFFHIPYDKKTKKGISIDGLAYAYAFDDQGNFSTDISKDSPTKAIVNIGE